MVGLREARGPLVRANHSPAPYWPTTDPAEPLRLRIPGSTGRPEQWPGRGPAVHVRPRFRRAALPGRAGVSTAASCDEWWELRGARTPRTPRLRRSVARRVTPRITSRPPTRRRQEVAWPADSGLGLGRRDEDRLVVHLVLDAQQSDQVVLHPWPFGHRRLEDAYRLLVVVAPGDLAEPNATDCIGSRDATENRESRRNTTKRQHRVIRLGIHELSYGHKGTGRDQSRASFVRATCVGSTAGSTHREPPLAVRTSASIDEPPKCSPSRRQLATSGSSA